MRIGLATVGPILIHKSEILVWVMFKSFSTQNRIHYSIRIVASAELGNQSNRHPGGLLKYAFGSFELPGRGSRVEGAVAWSLFRALVLLLDIFFWSFSRPGLRRFSSRQGSPWWPYTPSSEPDTWASGSPAGALCTLFLFWVRGHPRIVSDHKMLRWGAQKLVFAF